MNATQHAQQAPHFIEYWKSTGLDWELAFVRWGASKNLSPDDYYAIRQVVHMELVARGELSLTDLPEWAGDAGDDADDDEHTIEEAA